MAGQKKIVIKNEIFEKLLELGVIKGPNIIFSRDKDKIRRLYYALELGRPLYMRIETRDGKVIIVRTNAPRWPLLRPVGVIEEGPCAVSWSRDPRVGESEEVEHCEEKSARDIFWFLAIYGQGGIYVRFDSEKCNEERCVAEMEISLGTVTPRGGHLVYARGHARLITLR